jgi:hypothetical protein
MRHQSRVLSDPCDLGPSGVTPCLAFRGRPAKTHIAVISSLLIAGTTVAFVVVFLRDTHSTAALWFIESIAVTWGIWGLSAWTDTNGLP